MIEEFPEDTHAIEGEGVVFKVVVCGKPPPTLTWYHDEEEVTTNYAQEILDDGSLNIPSAEIKQGGVYKLVARNSAGSVEQSVKLTVQFEGEKTPDVERKSVTFTPIPVSEFGDYVIKNHASNNQGFRDQYMVRISYSYQFKEQDEKKTKPVVDPRGVSGTVLHLCTAPSSCSLYSLRCVETTSKLPESCRI